MDSARPNPDELLARVQAEQSKSARGKLKVFFGMAPGVGKTYAMLEAARKAGKEGVDVVVGYIEPHARPETQALVLGLDVLARREVPYHGTTLIDFDLDAALARKPQLILVDELAHTNAPGMAHAKRWQDVERLLAAGMDVYTTLNVQHLESLNDVVAQITGVAVRETVPDSIFEQADEIELVDLAPDDLIERLREGRVYVQDQARRAIDNFFQKGNLIALRELALRRTAERVDAQMTDYRREHAIDRMLPSGERLLVCVGSSPMSARLIRAARRMAASLRAPWVAVHVENPAEQLSDVNQQRLEQNLHLVEQLGGKIAVLSGVDPVEEIISYGRTMNATKIIVGKPQQPRWREYFRGSLVYELTRRSGDIDVYVISGDHEPRDPAAVRPSRAIDSRRPYAWALAVVAVCTAASFVMFDQLRMSVVNIMMAYLLGIVIVSLRWGRGPSILASILGVAAFDFFFIEPRFTFVVHDTQYVFTFAVMLFTGVVISTLMTRLKFQADAARTRERRTAALYELSRELAALQEPAAIAEAGIRHASDTTDARTCILVAGDEGRLMSLASPLSFQPSERDEGVAAWVYEHKMLAGLGTNTLPGADALYLPLATAHGAVGVLGALPTVPRRTFGPEQMHLLETLAGLIALAIERAQLSHQSEQRRVQVQTEQLRNSLLSAVSHDLRTPLAAIAGASSTLVDADTQLDPAVRRELASSIYDETERLNRLVANLLDMTRLEGGALKVEKQWQSLEEIVGVVLSRLAHRLAGHEVKTCFQADLSLVPMDDVLIQQVFVNLLENAAKYAPQGTAIEINATGNPHQVRVEVVDEGPGLKSGDERRVFEKFYRSSAGGRAGVGLGLAICRGIVELHGGRIWAENRRKAGAVFYFTLPIEGSPPAIQAESLDAEETTEQQQPQ